jgi:hypothetical protein
MLANQGIPFLRQMREQFRQLKSQNTPRKWLTFQVDENALPLFHS